MVRLSNRLRNILRLLPALFLAFVISTGCGQGPSSSKKEEGKGKIPILTPAGFEKLVQAHKGAVLVINFFTTWCEPCRKELPALVSLATSYKSKGVVFIGISLDKGGEKILTPFLKKIDIPYPVYMGNEALMERLKLHEIPTTYVYNKRGKRVYVLKGALTREALSRKIDSLVKAPSRS